MHILEQFADVAMDRELPADLAFLAGALGEDRLLVLAIKLLDPLKCGRLPKQVESHWTWCQDLQQALVISEELRQIFVLAADQLDFAPDLSLDERREIIQIARAYYQPRPPIV